MNSKPATTFKITSWDETTTQEPDDGGKITVAHVTQEYVGQLSGTGCVDYLMCYADASSAVFVGFERLVCAFDGIDDSFVIRHDGVYEDGEAKSQWSVVPNSGIGGLSGIRGSGSFKAGHGGEASVSLELSLGQ